MANPSRGILALAAGAALLPWLAAPWWPVRDAWNDFKWPAMQAVLLIVSALFLFDLKISAPQSARAFLRSNANYVLGIALIIGGLLLSVCVSPVSSLGMRIFLREAPLVIVALLLCVRGVSEKELRIVLFGLLASAFAQALLILSQFFGVLAPAGVTGRAAMVGTFGNPEYAAGWLAPLGAAAFAGAILVRERISSRSRIAFGFVFGAIALAIILGGGRGAALSAIIASAITFRLLRSNSSRLIRTKSALIAGGLLVLVLIGAFVPGLRQALPGRLVEMLDPYSVSIRHRIGLMTVTSHMIASDPLFGTGPGLYAAGFDQMRGHMAEESDEVGIWVFNEIMGDQTANEAHSDPLQWWAEYGTLSFIGLLLVISSALGRLWGVLKSSNRPTESALIFAALLTLTIGMFFSFPLHRPDRALLFWILVGLAHAIAFRDQFSADLKAE